MIVVPEAWMHHAFIQYWGVRNEGRDCVAAGS